ncbi:hypothetical protein L1887_57852 [Cichorium endivia]|nr:hypothetical protein L1887_57852 [Cichorium endivia]
MAACSNLPTSNISPLIRRGSNRKTPIRPPSSGIRCTAAFDLTDPTTIPRPRGSLRLVATVNTKLSDRSGTLVHKAPQLLARGASQVEARRLPSWDTSLTSLDTSGGTDPLSLAGRRVRFVSGEAETRLRNASICAWSSIGDTCSEDGGPVMPCTGAERDDPSSSLSPFCPKARKLAAKQNGKPNGKAQEPRQRREKYEPDRTRSPLIRRHRLLISPQCSHAQVSDQPTPLPCVACAIGPCPLPHATQPPVISHPQSCRPVCLSRSSSQCEKGSHVQASGMMGGELRKNQNRNEQRGGWGSSVAVVGRRKDGDHVAFLRPVEAVHDELVRARHEREAVVVVERLRDVLTKRVAGTARRDAPATAVVRVGPQQIAHGTLVRHFLDAVDGADVVERVVGVWRVAADAEEFGEVVELAVDVAADGDGAADGLHIRLAEQDLARLVAKTLDVVFRELLALAEVRDPCVLLCDVDHGCKACAVACHLEDGIRTNEERCRRAEELKPVGMPAIVRGHAIEVREMDGGRRVGDDDGGGGV